MGARRVGLPVLASGALLGPFIRNICSSWHSMSQGGPRALCKFQAGVGLWGLAASTAQLQAPEGRKG